MTTTSVSPQAALTDIRGALEAMREAADQAVLAIEDIIIGNDIHRREFAELHENLRTVRAYLKLVADDYLVTVAEAIAPASGKVAVQ